jgi:hypothetical protein
MLFVEFEMLADQSMRKAGRDADLIDREALDVEQDNTGKVLEVAAHGRLGVAGLLLDGRELKAPEVEIEDLGFV